MDKFTIKEVEKVYRNLRAENEIRFGYRTEKIYRDHPILKELDLKISRENAKIALEIAGDGNFRENSPEKDKLLKKKDKYIKENSIPEDYEMPGFNCYKCKDTGIIDSDNHMKCDCYKMNAYPILIKKSNFSNIEKYSFEKINLLLFSDETDIKNYRTKSSPRENIAGISKIAQRFVKNIENENTKNLFLIGKPGTGKTFISGCTAHSAILEGQSVYYLSAPSFFEKMSNYRVMTNSFSPDPERYDIALQEYSFILNCDLLIIDDLGTETPNANRQPDLLNILNYRTNLKNKMIISTNLEINNLSSIFDERVMSRIYGEFTVLRFIGDDLRHKTRQGS